MEEVESDPSVPFVIVKFNARKAAEIAMTNGRTFEDGQLDMQWVSDKNEAFGKNSNVTNSKNGETSAAEELDNGGPMEEDEVRYFL